MRTKIAAMNISLLLLQQLIATVSGLIIPRLLIAQYGSEVNGLIGSVNQFLSYITLLEGGVVSVVMASMYGPLHRKDMFEVSGIVEASKLFFRKIGLISFAYIGVLCFIYPLIIDSSLDRNYTISLIMILGVAMLIQYYAAMPYLALLKADQKLWVVSIASIASTLLVLIVSYSMIIAGAGIHELKLITCFAALIKPSVMTLYVRRHYALPKTSPNNLALSRRWNGLSHTVAYFIHSNTDIVLISLFMGLRWVSVYMVYRAVIAGLECIIVAIPEGCAAGFGDIIASGDKSALRQAFGRIEFLQSSLATVIYTIAAVMIIPFVRLYTAGINDAEYIQYAFAAVMILGQAVYCIRIIYSVVSQNANRHKETQLQAWLEAAMNLSVSIILIKPFGILGVALGTLFAVGVRYVLDVCYLSREVMDRPAIQAFGLLAANAAISAISIGVCLLTIDFGITSWLGWVLNAVLAAVIVAACALIVYAIFYRDQLRGLVDTAKRLLKRG